MMIERLKQFILNQDLSVRAFEQSISASDGMIRRAINNGTDIQCRWLSTIADNYPTLNLEWLITGRGCMLRGAGVVKAYSFPEPVSCVVSEPELPYGRGSSSRLYRRDGLVRIPVVDISVAAGSGCYNEDYLEEVDCITLPLSMVSNGRSYICVRVKGQSMTPSILDGGYLVVYKLERTEWANIRDNYVHVVSDAEGRAYVKRLKNRLVQHGFVVCMSDNVDKQNYPNFNLHEQDINTVWYAEWYFSAKIPNIQETYYRKQAELEDRLDELSAQFQQFSKSSLPKPAH